MNNIVREFREFAMKGNVVDLAIGVIIGAAFGKIVESLVGDLFMPVLGAVTGGLDFSNFYIPLSSAVQWGLPLAEARKAGAVLAYGNFITIAINFLIVAWALFVVVKVINRLKMQALKDAAAAPSPALPADVALLTEIRDLLAKDVTAKR